MTTVVERAPVPARAGRASAARPRNGTLDGLRAIAVLAVVVYHLWPNVLPAGFLGVDLFMVLSGYLITGLLLDDRARHGAVRLRAFWGRRFRRLVPALLATLTIVSLWVRFDGPRTLEATVRGQGIAALLYFANWRLILDGVSYAALAKPPSPLLHLWSLAVEEQFYVLWPLVVVGLLALGRGRHHLVAVVAAAGAVASAVTMAVLFSPSQDPLRLYYGTDTRAQTFLVGAIAAVAVRGSTFDRLRRAVSAAAGGALVAVVVAFFAADRSAFLYRGGFALFAVVAAIAVLGAAVGGVTSALLDRAPLRLIGRTSYGIYLWHWPVIVLVNEERVGFGGVALLLLRLGLIAGATALSWIVVEQPAQRIQLARGAVLAPVAVAVTAVAVLSLTSTPIVAYAGVDVSRAPPASVITPEPTSTSPASVTTATTIGPAVVPRVVLLVGDSGMYDAAPALAAGLGAAGSEVVSVAYAGEGLTRPAGVRDQWARAVDQYRPDLVVVMLGGWDGDYIVNNGDDAYRAQVDATVTMLTRFGAHVLWLAELPGGTRQGDPDRFFAALPPRYPGVVDFVDLQSSLADATGAHPRVVNGQLFRKPDGWHLCPAGAAAFASALIDHLRLSAPEWQNGDWRADARYDDPPGGCRP